METRNRGNYEIADRELVAEGTDLRVQVLTLAPGQAVPWHYHSEITDHFVCLEGEIAVRTKSPDRSHILQPGERCAVGPNTAHLVYGNNRQTCKFMIIQGTGTYDFIPVAASRSE